MSKKERIRMMIDIKWKKYWGVIPIVVFLTGKIIVKLIGAFTDSVLRSVPQMILSCFGVISIYILVFWIGRFFWRNREQLSTSIRIVQKVLIVIYCVMIVGTVGMGLFFRVFSYHPEYVVERNGIRMGLSGNR